MVFASTRIAKKPRMHIHSQKVIGGFITVKLFFVFISTSVKTCDRQEVYFHVPASRLRAGMFLISIHIAARAMTAKEAEKEDFAVRFLCGISKKYFFAIILPYQYSNSKP